MRTTNWGGAIVLAWAVLLGGCMGDSGSPQTDNPTMTNPNEEESDTPVDSDNPGDSDDDGEGDGSNSGGGSPPLFPKDPVVRAEPAGTGAAPARWPLPHSAAPNGVPDHASIVPPAVDGRVGGGSLGGMSGIHAHGGKIDGIHHIDQPDWWSEGGDLTPEEFGLERARQLETAIHEIGLDKVAAFIGEPIQGAGGVIIPPSTYWPEIQRICDKYGILLIADEVITGFGRTGNMFGSTTFGIRPHIMTIAKGLSSGYQPIGGSIIHDEVFKVVAEGGELYHGYTYSGHPVAAAVALENLRIIQEEGIIDHVRNVAHPYLKAKWDALTEHPMVGEAKLVGLMGSIALTPNKATRAKFKAEAGTVGYKVRERCFANNIIMRHVGDRMIIAPPLVIKPAEIDILMERATKSLDEAYKIVKDEGLFVAG